MSHFVDHWPVDLQQKVREDAEKIVSLLYCTFTYYYPNTSTQ